MGKVNFVIKDAVGFVTLNRPEVLNCFDYETLVELGEIVENLHLSREARVVIFTGAGEKAFSAGADLKERKTLTADQVRRNVKKIRDVFSAIAQLPQPTIAAINGYALGGGMELALACDFRFAHENVKMGLPETSMAIIPGAGGTQRLPRLIGESRALELILTAERIDAKKAKAYGLLVEITKQETLLETAERFARRILENGPIAVQQAKFAVKRGIETDLQTGLDIESQAYEATIPTKDRVEALKAFSEKRKPEFKGE